MEKEIIKIEVIKKYLIIETKRSPNESFPLRWKFFKKLLNENKIGPFTLYKPQNQIECDETVRLILEKQKG